MEWKVGLGGRRVAEEGGVLVYDGDEEGRLLGGGWVG